MSAVRQFCTFFLDNLYLGVEVRKVQEVIRYQEMTQVPLAQPVIQGLINLRGQIVMAIDMRRRLGLPELPTGQRPMNVVIRTDDGPVSLLVDEIGDVMEVHEDSYERPPETLRGPVQELILGAYKLKGRLLLTFDTDRAVRVGGHHA
ncbi:MAG: chemotaxis protein CheW [Planctomycetota bacterium]